MKLQQLHVQFLDTAGLSDRWLRHPETIRRMARTGALPSHLIGRRRLFALDAIVAFERSAEVGLCRSNGGVSQKGVLNQETFSPALRPPGTGGLRREKSPRLDGDTKK